jgi:hypothetical protein
VRNYQAVKIAGVSVHENTFTSGKKVWFVANLIDRSKELVKFDLPLAAIYAGSEVWEPVSSAYGLAKQMRRVLDVDTSYPIILDQEGFIMDGWHRVARALIDGESTIKAVRFAETPPHDYLKPDA